MTHNKKNTHFSKLPDKPGKNSRESGIAYVAILFILVILSSLSMAFILKVGRETSATMKRGEGMQAHYLAETAANHAMWRLLNNYTNYHRVSHSDDDASEELDGDMRLGDVRLELGARKYNGVRFLDVNIPQGATITNAYVYVKAEATHSENTDITIRGEDTDNASRFVDVVNDISDRTQTFASVTWNNIPSWTAGNIYKTPDLSTIIQEIVDRPGWSSGNSMVIMFESTDPGGKRFVTSHDYNYANASLLDVDYSGSTALPALNVYTMHSMAGGRYGYKIRRHTNRRFATIATVGAIGENVVNQSYVLYVPVSDSDAIEIDAVSTSPGGDIQTDNWSHTVSSSGSDRILIVGVAYQGGADRIVTSVTYGGQDLNRVGKVDTGTNSSSEIWYLVNPPTGTNMVSATLNEKNKIICGAISFLNVNQSTPLGPFFSATGVSDSPSLDVTSVNEGEVVIDHIGVKSGFSGTVGSGQDEHWDVSFLSDISSLCSTEPGPVGGGTVTMSWTLSQSSEWAQGGVALKPANP